MQKVLIQAGGHLRRRLYLTCTMRTLGPAASPFCLYHCFYGNCLDRGTVDRHSYKSCVLCALGLSSFVRELFLVRTAHTQVRVKATQVNFARP